MAAGTEIVGIGEMKISADPTAILSAPNLGSCVAVAAYDPDAKVGSMIHCLLPLSTSHPEKKDRSPYTFVDIGVVKMFQELLQKGARKERLVVCVAGGSNISDHNNVFEIGKKNYTVLRKVLWKNNILIKAEHVGEGFSRTFTLKIDSGEVTVKFDGKVVKMV